MRILVVEDEQDLNRILAKTLTAEGYSVDTCFDGVEALDYLEGAEYDAIVLDVMMPRMDGFSLLAQMRESGSSCTRPQRSSRRCSHSSRDGFRSAPGAQGRPHPHPHKVKYPPVPLQPHPL